MAGEQGESSSGTGRSAAEIEAELASIDNAARELTLQTGNEGKPAPKTDDRDFEYEARRKGWKPETDYTGPDGKWVDAKTFVERGERFTGKLLSQVEHLTAQVAAFEGTKAQFRQFFDREMAKRDKEHSEALTALRIQRSQAVRDGDDELAIELEDRIDTAKEQQRALKAEATQAAAEKTTPAASATPALDNPVLQDWIEEGNAWFKDDEVLAKHAITVGKVLRENGEKAIGRKFLELVKEQVQSDFPRRFKPATGARQTTAEGNGQGGTGASGSATYNGKTERDLPAEDLAIMRELVKDKVYTKEQFLKSYFSRNGR